MSVTVHVTQEDIDNGKALQAHLCPIARAIKRTLGRSQVTVTEITILSELDEYLVTKSVFRFIQRFDSGLPVRPFTFELSSNEETA